MADAKSFGSADLVMSFGCQHKLPCPLGSEMADAKSSGSADLVIIGCAAPVADFVIIGRDGCKRTLTAFGSKRFSL